MANHSSRSRGNRSRRSIAMLTWTGLVIAAGLLWYARLNGTIRGVASETVVLLLSAFAGFSSIFAWMLFSPNRRSETESSALFFGGALTLLPPCIIAFCLMPSDSPLRGWLTLGVFMLTMLAVLTPIPEEFFAVPRDRSTYLRPISESLFSSLEVLDRPHGFEKLQLAGQVITRQALPQELDGDWQRKSGDPWLDPFRGTGIEPTRPGARKRPAVAEQKTPAPQRDQDLREPSPALPRPTAEVRLTPPPVPAPSRSAPAAQEVTRRPTGHRSFSQRPATAFGFQAPAPISAPRAMPPATSTPTSPMPATTSWPPLPLPVVDSPVADLHRGIESSDEEDSPAEADLSGRPESLDVERIEDEFGGVMVEGTVKVYFQAGQKRANIHIPFSPPLPGIPEVECESIGDDVLRLKVPVRQTYGIRIEARRSDASQALETEIGFAAVHSAPGKG